MSFRTGGSRSARSIPGSALSGGRATRLSLNDLGENEPYIPTNKEVGKYTCKILVLMGS